MDEKQPLFKKKSIDDENIAVLAALVNSEKDKMTTTEIKDWTEQNTEYNTLNTNQVRHRIKKSLNIDSDVGKHKYLHTKQPTSENGESKSKVAWIDKDKLEEVTNIVDSYNSDLSVSKFSDIESAFTTLVSRQEEYKERLQEVEKTQENDKLEEELEKLEDSLDELKETVTEGFRRLQDNERKLENRIKELEDQI